MPIFTCFMLLFRLPQVVEQAFESAEMSAEPEEDAREERVFRLWMNSLNLNDGATVVHSLFKDLSEGATLVDAILAVAGDSVSLGSRKVNREKINNFKRVSACLRVVNAAQFYLSARRCFATGRDE